MYKRKRCKQKFKLNHDSTEGTRYIILMMIVTRHTEVIKKGLGDRLLV